jgi:predicted PurR-regulated permease PerM
MFGVGVLTTLALFVISVEYALLLGVFMGVMEFIPIVGPWIGGVPAVLIAFLDDPTKGLWALILILAVQQIESQIITPWAMSSQANVHPVITLFALILFGGMFGFLGILLAVPLVLLTGTIIEVLWVEETINADADYIPPVAEE